MRIRTSLKFLLPLVVLALALAGGWWLVASKPAPGKQRLVAPPPAVRVQKVVKRDLRLTVVAQGVVRPRNETQLVAEVPGRVIFISPALAAGGFFDSGDLLIKLDPTDYRLALVQAESALARSELDLSMRRAEAESAREEWKRLKGGRANPLVLKEPQLAEAQAALRGAQAALEQARYNLTRTEVRAPYAGRVRQEFVDLGQYVTAGYKMAEVYGVDFAEVRLPLPDEKLAFLELPLDYRNGRRSLPHPQVTISASFAGRRFTWQGRVVRTEGELDPRSRMVLAVAQIENPYGRGSDPERPPLASGMFVEAEIMGKLARQVARLPRSALRDRDTVLVVEKGRLFFRKIKLLDASRDRALISGGLEEGELVCVTPLEAAVEGMKVAVMDQPAPARRPAPEPPKP